ncbi:MAG: sigma-70 family RNA polymerase sigma factor [Myxococcales bacterium]|nr:sigma-70 family RNA polymerase sigma factor [Myxococcota bacterium]MDW8283727.1 sigma-70 family RNA polymerase sigma factor [Myxococcales bacterium]
MKAERVDDRLLVEQARRGQRRAFQALVERYQSKVYALALGLVRDREEAQDLAQEAFLKAHQSLNRFQGESSFYTWLYRITVNLCIDHLRRARRGTGVAFDERLQLEEADGSAEELSPQPLGFDPHRALQDKQLRERIQQALGELSEAHRAVLLLREVDGLSYKEMAEVLGCAEGTIMSRLFHARKRMQQMLRAWVEPPPGGRSEEAAE